MLMEVLSPKDLNVCDGDGQHFPGRAGGEGGWVRVAVGRVAAHGAVCAAGLAEPSTRVAGTDAVQSPAHLHPPGCWCQNSLTTLPGTMLP